MKGTKQDEEEFEMLLGEIPRATSAPPHLEELHRVNKFTKDEGNSVPQREDAQKSPIPEAYEGFYQGYEAVKTLSASPVGNIALHSPSSKSSLTSFYGSLSMDGSQLPKGQGSQLQGLLHQQIKIEEVKEEDKKPSSTSLHQNGVALPTQQFLPDDQCLANAFVNLSLQEDKALKQPSQLYVGHGDGGFGGGVLEDGQHPIRSAGPYSTFGVLGMSGLGHFNQIHGETV